jgi:hypothetical protein
VGILIELEFIYRAFFGPAMMKFIFVRIHLWYLT